MILPNFYRDFLTALIMVQWLCGIYAVDRRVLKEDRGPMNADYRHYKVDHKNVHCFLHCILKQTFSCVTLS